MFYILVGAGIAWALYNLIVDWYQVRFKNFPPGPLSLPLIGGLYSLNPNSPHLSIEKLVKKYGKVLHVRMGPMGKMVFIQDINLINQVFENTEYNDRPEFPIFDILNRGANGIGSCQYDERWKTLYKIMHSGLTKITKNKLEEIVLGSYGELIKRFQQRGKVGENYDPRDDCMKSYTSILSCLVYGIKSKSLDSAELQTRIKYHNNLMAAIQPTHLMNIFPFLWKITTPIKKRLMQCLTERDTLFQRSYENHTKDFDGNLRDLIDIIAEFEQSKENSEEMKEKMSEIKKEDMFLSAWTMYLAGCDTSLSVTQWMMFYLCQHLHVQQSIQEEVDRLDGREKMGTLDQKEKLSYTRATILETLRMASTIGPGLPRVSSKDQHLGGYDMPKGTIFMLNQWHIHHDAELWPEPFAFKPERFLDESGQLYSHYHIFKKMPFIPFSRGKRTCIGQHLAIDMFLVFLVELMKHTTIQFPKDYHPDQSAIVTVVLKPQPFPIECIQRETTTRDSYHHCNDTETAST